MPSRPAATNSGDLNLETEFAGVAEEPTGRASADGPPPMEFTQEFFRPAEIASSDQRASDADWTGTRAGSEET
jgi:hypothetical protein